MERLIKVRVLPRARKNEVKPFQGGLKVCLTAPPADGKANKALIKLLSEHLKVKRSRLSLAGGARSRDKLIKIT